MDVDSSEIRFTDFILGIFREVVEVEDGEACLVMDSNGIEVFMRRIRSGDKEDITTLEDIDGLIENFLSGPGEMLVNYYVGEEGTFFISTSVKINGRGLVHYQRYEMGGDKVDIEALKKDISARLMKLLLDRREEFRGR